MKINMYSTPADGSCGIGIYTRSLINEMKKYKPELRISNVTVNRYSRNPIHFLRKAWELSRDCDVAHIQFEYDFFGKFPITGFWIPLFFSTLKILSKLRSFKIITTMHSVWETKNPPKAGKMGAIYTFVVNKFVTKLSDKVVALSETIEEKLLEEGISRYKLVRLPHGTMDPIILNKEECKKMLGLDPEKKLITIFGYIRLIGDEDIKGHDLFLEAARRLNDKNVVFMIAGDGQTEREKAYLNKLKENANSQIVFYGFVENDMIPIVLNATDIMVMPYRKIAVSGVLNLSLAYGIPTITSDLDYFRKIKKNYDCILTVPKEDPEALKEAIKELLYNKELVDYLKSKSKDYLSDNSFKKVVEKLAEIYREKKV